MNSDPDIKDAPRQSRKSVTQDISISEKAVIPLSYKNGLSAAPSSLLLQMMPVGVTVHDPQGRIIECNPAAARLLGLSEAELLTRSTAGGEWDILSESDAPLPAADFPVNRVLAAKCPVAEVIMGARHARTGGRVWLLVNAEPVFEVGDRLLYVVCTFTDVSERRRAESARRDSEARYRLLFDSSPQATWVCDSETLEILAVNRAALEQYGYTQDEFLALTAHDIHAAQEISAFQDAIEAAGQAAADAEVWKHLHRDGSTLEMRVSMQALQYREREARLMIAENITGRRHVERTLKRLNKRIANILESIRDGFVTLDRQWQFTYMNSRAEQIFHTRHDELIGQNFWEVFPELRRAPFYKEYHRAMQKQSPVEFEYRFAAWDAWLRINVFPSQDGLSIYLADITDRKRVEQELQDTIASLKRSVDGIVQAMSYAVELRDPYTAGHQKRVSLLVCAMARQAGHSADEIERFRVAALLHDIGKIAMPAEILSKPGQLSRAEMSIIQGHSQLGYDILKGIDFAPQIALVALQHHERLDGSGYPNGLSASEIIPEAKMMAVADVVEAMASHRPFRASLGIEKALHEVMRNKGILYDPAAVDACLAVFAQHGFDFENLLHAEEAIIPAAAAS